MDGFIRSRITALAGIIVFGSLCDMILPSGTYKKYLNLTIGVILCLTVLSPLKNIGNLKKSDIFDRDAYETSAYTQDTQNPQKEQILAVCEEKLSASVKSDVTACTDAEIEVKCKVADDDESFGSVESVWIGVFNGGDTPLPPDVARAIADKYGISKDAITVKYINDLKQNQRDNK